MKTPIAAVKPTIPKPPANLSAPARKWWSNIRNEYSIADQAGLLILTTAAEAFERMRQAQAIIDKDGLTTTDRHGQLKAHPCCQIERDNRQQLLSCLRQLNLDLEPLRDRVGRPSGSKSSGFRFA